MKYPKKKWLRKKLNTDINQDISIKKLFKKLDKIFSEYIRRRDSDKNGICRCITCGRSFHWKQIDCGHFVHRDRLVIRWDERNVAPQCVFENRFRSGEQFKFGLAIDKKWGKGTAEMLQNLGKARGVKIDKIWLQIKIKEYKEKLERIKK